MDEPSAAAEVPPGDHEETSAAEDSGIPGPMRIPGPKNGYDFNAMFMLFATWAMLYKPPEDQPGVSRRTILKQSAAAQVFLNTAVNYILEHCFWQSGDVVEGADDFYGTGKAGFLHGLALINLLPTFPILCGPIASAIVMKYGHYFRGNGALWVYLGGYFDADGGVTCKLITWPSIFFAMKGVSALKTLILNTYAMFTESSCERHIHSPISAALGETIPEIFVGLELFTVLKKDQFRSIMMLGSFSGMGALIGAKDSGERRAITEGIHQSQTAKMVRVALGYLLSFLNRVHGTLTSAVEFTSRLRSIANRGRMLLILYIAGLFGADGSVGVTGKKGLGYCVLFQSNKPFLLAVAYALNTLLGFEGNKCLRVQRRNTTCSPRTLAKYYIRINFAQFYPVMFTVGLLDYNRAPQWILTLALRRVVEDKTLDEKKKKKVIAFLKDMLVWIKVVRMS